MTQCNVYPTRILLVGSYRKHSVVPGQTCAERSDAAVSNCPSHTDRKRRVFLQCRIRDVG
ncbi:hypothetical protein BCAR13_710113 [Paraburkholderia caribensis]|nr:hypothetical protein BCAR13_710113 [Paraburkholderia caribensis]